MVRGQDRDHAGAPVLIGFNGCGDRAELTWRSARKVANGRSLSQGGRARATRSTGTSRGNQRRAILLSPVAVAPVPLKVLY
jgi:hypothetical protein